ncbi:MAG: polyprenyl synthetase family protein [Bacteroidota bacterium]|nr:polyprenyl synthetase family protein [Bacteroidota bacterium]
MAKLEEIKFPVSGQIEEFEKKFSSSMKSSVPLLNKITHYIVKRKGKQIRPLFVFLSANMHGDVSESTFSAASLIEILHTATLVHDDIVDDSNMRRGFFSLNALWKNKISVLVGDYLLSQGLLLAMENKEYDLLQIVSKATQEMSEGELLQIEKARRLDIKEEVYFEIIRKKTASLIASCCACGASSVKADEQVVQKMHKFGEMIGIAFQIKDDLLDYEKTSLIGKPKGVDIKEKKMTLPLIYVLNTVPDKERKKVIKAIKYNHDNPKKVAEIIEKVKSNGGIEYANKIMEQYRDDALKILKEFPQNKYRDSLEQLVLFTTERKK